MGKVITVPGATRRQAEPDTLAAQTPHTWVCACGTVNSKAIAGPCRTCRGGTR
ncbi:hypothetical protein [Spongiactinospora sp. TRM90649]|uniref:hypothetical protein n=1 Tax=Spongiactinospora sp. TRM90649 TaxID=3031114 RepID=UPI0023F7B050|nr:hypothetical protein [Spongiactinospora sp. TRM90649]MDF5758769.1 hypothetical protein [Spongiactinospora sp. TRM90649]